MNLLSVACTSGGYCSGIVALTFQCHTTIRMDTFCDTVTFGVEYDTMYYSVECGLHIHTCLKPNWNVSTGQLIMLPFLCSTHPTSVAREQEKIQMPLGTPRRQLPKPIPILSVLPVDICPNQFPFSLYPPRHLPAQIISHSIFGSDTKLLSSQTNP